MLRGIYSGTCGMLINEVRHNVVANNLANIDTVGFKKSIPVFSCEPLSNIYKINDNQEILKNKFINKPQYIGQLGTQTVLYDVYITTNQPGTLNVTNNPSDLAISGDGFFAIETKDGIKFTRAGNFVLNKDGELTDLNGNFVLMIDNTLNLENKNITFENGNINIPFKRIKIDPLEKYNITEEGMIIQNGQNVGKLLIVKFDKNNLIKKVGNNLIEPLENNNISLSDNYIVHQGMLEMSNVNAIYEMVNMIELQRAYELNQKVILTHDEMLQKAINFVGKLNP